MAMTAMENFIRRYAASIGLNPDVVMQTVHNEGGSSSLHPAGYARQSLLGDNAGPGQEPSYGPFQMHMRYLGKKALEAGFDPRDPAQAFNVAKFAMDEIKRDGLTQWHGWKGGRWAAHGGEPSGEKVDVPAGPTGKQFDLPATYAAGGGDPNTPSRFDFKRATDPVQPLPTGDGDPNAPSRFDFANAAKGAAGGGYGPGYGGGGGGEGGGGYGGVAASPPKPKNKYAEFLKGMGDIDLPVTKFSGEVPAQPNAAVVRGEPMSMVNPEMIAAQRQALAQMLAALNQNSGGGGGMMGQ